MRKDLFQPTEESEARLLLLISAFSQSGRCLEGRTKLAKLDFLLRYPAFLRRAMKRRGVGMRTTESIRPENNIDSRMVRYRYGPWDPAYFAILGRLIGKGLIEPIPFDRGIGYRATKSGLKAAEALSQSDAWSGIANNIDLLRRKMDIRGSHITKFIYDNFPEVAGSKWGDEL